MQRLGAAFAYWMYRVTGGRAFGSWLLVLTTRGRRSGERRSVAVRYVRDGGDYVVVGTNWGKSTPPAWYLNLQADPHVELNIRGRTFQAEARTVRLQERQPLWEALVRSYRPYERYLDMTTRVFPIVRLTPTAGA
jgi:deazaflavin-dependent oxidoreductase (nitroreductase family)